MKYTNALLTIIAACLIFQVIQSFKQKPIPVTVQTQEKTAAPVGTLDVRVVEISAPLKVDISSVAGDKLDRIHGGAILPVAVQNTVDTDIKGVNGHLSDVLMRDGLPVVILNK